MSLPRARVVHIDPYTHVTTLEPYGIRRRWTRYTCVYIASVAIRTGDVIPIAFQRSGGYALVAGVVVPVTKR